MTTATPIPVDRPGATAPAAWGDIHFDVDCPRCGLDLRGSTASSCGQCGLDLDWAQLVPLDELRCVCGYALRGLPVPRCPECGKVFDWNYVVDQHRRKKKELFEYCWRTRPVRSLFLSMSLAMRPWRLWRVTNIYDPPAPRAMVGLLAVATCLSIIIVPAAQMFAVLAAGLVYRSILGSPVPLRIDWSGGWLDYWFSESLRRLTGVQVLPPVWVVLLAMTGGAWGVLMILRQSMRKARIKTAHVFRAFAYVLLQLPAFLLIGSFYHFVVLAGGWSLGLTYRTYRQLEALEQLCALPIAMWMVAGLAIAYRRYLRMRHAWGIALAAGLIATLFGTTVVVVSFFVFYG